MVAVFVMLAKASAHEPDKMTSVNDDQMIELLSSATADPSFRETILPGTAVSGPWHGLIPIAFMCLTGGLDHAYRGAQPSGEPETRELD